MGVSLTVALAGAALAADGDPVAGERVFGRRASCHSTAPGENRIGPSLAGISGRMSGTVPQFKYSPALQNANVVWDEAALDEFLQNPVKFIPRSRMLVSVSNADDRRNVIAYLRSLAQ